MFIMSVMLILCIFVMIKFGEMVLSVIDEKFVGRLLIIIMVCGVDEYL